MALEDLDPVEPTSTVVLTQDVLLPLLLTAIVVNLAIILIVVVTGRSGQRRDLAAAGSSRPSGPRPALTNGWTAQVERFATEPLAGTDPIALPESAPDHEVLGGLLDAAGWASHVATEDSRVRRYHHPATIVVIEFDGLRQAMEIHGSDIGRRVLPGVAGISRRLARDADHVGRLGPGEFTVLLAETDEISAINYVERIRVACEEWLAATEVGLGMAIGWAGTTGDPTLPDAQRLATERMHAERARRAAAESADTADSMSAWSIRG
jgi:diguanylate cyclase (GGDEF)-like protein